MRAAFLLLPLLLASPASAESLSACPCTTPSVTLELDKGAGTVTLLASDLPKLGLSPVPLSLAVSTEDGPLLLGGTVSDGSYGSSGISLGGTLDLLHPFDFERDGVLMQLGSGSVEVEVSSNRLVRVGLAVNFTVEVDVKSDVSSTLILKGDIKGEYRPGPGLDLEGSLTVQPDFVYTKDPVVVVLRSGGAASVTVEQSDFVELTLGPEVDIDVEIPQASSALKLTGTISGKYESGKIDIDATLSLREPFTYEAGPVTATLSAQNATAGVITRTLLPAQDEIELWLSIDAETGALEARGDEAPPGNSGPGGGNSAAPNSQAFGLFAFDCGLDDQGLLVCTRL